MRKNEVINFNQKTQTKEKKMLIPEVNIGLVGHD